LGSDESSQLLNVNDDIMHFENDPSLNTGEAPVKEELYLGLCDFNCKNEEWGLNEEQIRILSFQAGDLILVTALPNESGWFEGYRANDP